MYPSKLCVAVFLILSMERSSYAVSSCRPYENNAMWCCNGHTYLLGYLNRTLLHQCVNTPTNEDLSIADSYWALLRCAMKKLLGSTPLTRTSFAKQMAKFLPSEMQEAIAKQQTPPATDGATDAMPSVETLKDYWRGYFQTHTQVCNITKENRTKEWFWQPVLHCDNDSVVPFLYLGSSADAQVRGKRPPANATRRCVAENFKGFFNSTKLRSWQYIAKETCVSILTNKITITDLQRDNFTFWHRLSMILPPFYSRRAVREFMDKLLEVIKFDHDESAGNYTEVRELSYYVHVIQQRLQKDINEANEHGEHLTMSAFISNVNVLTSLQDTTYKAMNQMCRSHLQDYYY